MATKRSCCCWGSPAWRHAAIGAVGVTHPIGAERAAIRQPSDRLERDWPTDSNAQQAGPEVQRESRLGLAVRLAGFIVRTATKSKVRIRSTPKAIGMYRTLSVTSVSFVTAAMCSDR
jgi:hypothetical protein